jgi:hypothetical protein
MPYTSGTVTATGAGTAVTDSALDGYGPASMGVVIFSGTFTSAAVTVEKKVRGSSVWLPLAMTNEKTLARTSGTASPSDSTTTSYRVDLGGAGAWRAYPTAGTVSSGMLIELVSGAVEDFGGILPAVYTTHTDATTFAAGLTLSGATGVNTVSIPDNLASALDITEGSNSYIKCVTTNGSESVDVAKVINAAAGVQGVVANEIVTATNVITAAESGKTFFLNSATEFVSTLPAVAAGLKYTFIVTAAPSGASYTVVTNSSANIIKGNQNSVAGDAGDFGTADDTITFVDGQSVAGDKVEVISDGTSWFAYAISKVAAGITFTQAS